MIHRKGIPKFLARVLVLYIHVHISDTAPGYCEERHNSGDGIIQVCHNQTVTGRKIYIDSYGAKGRQNAECKCVLKPHHHYSPQNTKVTVSTVTGGGSGITFFFQNQHFNSTNPVQWNASVTDQTFSIQFTKVRTSGDPAMCLGLLVAEFTNITVTCFNPDGYDVGNSSPDTSTAKAPDPESKPTTGAGRTSEDHNQDNEDGKSTFNTGIVIGALGTLVVALAVSIIVILCCRKKNQKPISQQEEQGSQPQPRNHEDSGDYYLSENESYVPADTFEGTRREQQGLLSLNAEVIQNADYEDIETEEQRHSAREMHHGTEVETSVEEGGTYNHLNEIAKVSRPTTNIYDSCVEDHYNELNKVNSFNQGQIIYS